jgi:hypothetical protein
VVPLHIVAISSLRTPAVAHALTTLRMPWKKREHGRNSPLRLVAGGAQFKQGCNTHFNSSLHAYK